MCKCDSNGLRRRKAVSRGYRDGYEGSGGCREGYESSRIRQRRCQYVMDAPWEEASDGYEGSGG
jgi:hypothetical protein